MQNTETIGNEKINSSGRIAWRRLPLAVPLAAVAAAAANALVYFTASALGLIPESILIPTASGESPLTVGMVMTASVIGSVGAGAVFAAIGLFARRPIRLFRIVAAVVLVLSFATPLTVPDAPLAMVLSMEVMHVVAWATIVGLLTTLAQQEASV